jgi:hypothetical protein
MSKRTQRRADQRRLTRLNREQTGATNEAKPLSEAKPLQPAETNPTTSPAQIAANRDNSTHSTGPTSEIGKAIVSQNRTIHGLNYNPNTFRVLACEDQAAYDDLLHQLTTDHKPTGTTETLLVTSLAQHRWLLDRANRLQETCFNQQTAEITDQKLFTLYLRYATTHERAFHKCLTDLLKLRSTKQNLAIGFESEKRRTDRHKNFLNLEEINFLLQEQKLSNAQSEFRRAERNAAIEERFQKAA